MRKLFGIIFFVVIFSSCEKQNEMFFPPEVGDVTLYGVTAKTVYAESYIEDSKNIDVDECGFCVYPNDDKTDVRYVKAVLSNGMFSVKIDSLKPGTDYRIKAYARNAVGIGYSDSEKICKTSLSVAEISTNNVLDITPTTAVCGGNITSDGGLQVTERGVCWSTSHNPTIYNNRTTDGTGIGSFTSSITDLTNETTYYVRAYATNSMGTAYGDEKCFLTTAKPTVMTRLVTDVLDTSAVCGGNVTSVGSSPLTARGVCWATRHNPTIDDDKTFDGVDVGEFISNITELTEGTVYHVRAYATNEEGTSYGEEIAFRTLTFPTVSTNIVTNVSFTTATCGGNISSDGGAEVTARGVCWSTSQNPTISDNKTIDGEGLGNFTSNITGLASGTIYSVRAYATNSVGTAYGEIRYFTTAVAVIPVVQTNSATDITANSATMNGNISSDGGAEVISRGFVYGLNSNNLERSIQCGSVTGNFNKNIAGLSQGTTYYYKAYATNSVGTAYGELMSFKTLALPTISTGTITNITETSAKCGGYISSDGGATITVRGVCWSTSHNPTINDRKTIDGTGTGNFISNITGLTVEITYYVRAYATNSVGTAYGDEKQFTTERTTGVLNGFAWVDLGFPSGLKWATCNLMSNNPQGYGRYYSWGETSPKSYYMENNYTYNEMFECLPASADVATVRMGSGWRMPTRNDFIELIDNCTYSWTTLNGVYGGLFTGPNGNSIFLPAGGSYGNYDEYSNGLNGLGVFGCYWSSTILDYHYAYKLSFSSTGCDSYDSSARYRGLSVRAVCQ